MRYVEVNMVFDNENDYIDNIEYFIDKIRSFDFCVNWSIRYIIHDKYDKYIKWVNNNEIWEC